MMMVQVVQGTKSNVIVKIYKSWALLISKFQVDTFKEYHSLLNGTHESITLNW
jgi:hypothetical protein